MKSVGCVWCERAGERKVHVLLNEGTGDSGEREALSLSSDFMGGLVVLVISFKAFMSISSSIESLVSSPSPSVSQLASAPLPNHSEVFFPCHLHLRLFGFLATFFFFLPAPLAASFDEVPVALSAHNASLAPSNQADQSRSLGTVQSSRSIMIAW